MDKHTPGPWTWKYNENRYGDLEILGPGGETVVKGCGCCDSPYGDNMKHDAPLMNAAPDLLEALESLLDAQNGPPLLGRHEADWQKTMDAARAAIKKARGE